MAIGCPSRLTWGLWVGGVCLAAVLCKGCDPEARYRALSFFFDDVPHPNGPRGTGDQTVAGRGPASGQPERTYAAYYTHKPYAEQKCGLCHGGTGTEDLYIGGLNSDMCLKCHAGTPWAYPVMHGPVAVAACLWCHTAHESTIPHLLRQAPPAVCAQCHDRKLLGANPPAHGDPKRNCLDCHVGHGGAGRNLLRASAATGASERSAARETGS